MRTEFLNSENQNKHSTGMEKKSFISNIRAEIFNVSQLTADHIFMITQKVDKWGKYTFTKDVLSMCSVKL